MGYALFPIMEITGDAKMTPRQRAIHLVNIVQQYCKLREHDAEELIEEFRIQILQIVKDEDLKQTVKMAGPDTTDS
jgi:hypothetical protein